MPEAYCVKLLEQEFEDLVSPTAPLKVLASGFQFTEGPVWHPQKRILLFSDIPKSERWQWDGTEVSRLSSDTNMTNGMTLDRDLNLLICEHATSSVSIVHPEGGRKELATHFGSDELNSPNDICVRSDGLIYFTDPWYGRTSAVGIERPRDLGWQGVFHISPACKQNEPMLLVDKDMFTQPNGLCFSPDERHLYVNDSEQGNIRLFDVMPDGLLSNPRIFAGNIKAHDDPGEPDGMRCDSLGNVWTAAPRGLWIFNPSGKKIGEIEVPEVVGNFHWGGEDWRTLFLCATTSLYAISVRVGPRIEPFMRNVRL